MKEKLQEMGHAVRDIYERSCKPYILWEVAKFRNERIEYTELIKGRSNSERMRWPVSSQRNPAACNLASMKSSLEKLIRPARNNSSIKLFGSINDGSITERLWTISSIATTKCFGSGNPRSRSVVLVDEFKWVREVTIE